MTSSVTNPVKAFAPIALGLAVPTEKSIWARLENLPSPFPALHTTTSGRNSAERMCPEGEGRVGSKCGHAMPESDGYGRRGYAARRS